MRTTAYRRLSTWLRESRRPSEAPKLAARAECVVLRTTREDQRGRASFISITAPEGVHTATSLKPVVQCRYRPIPDIQRAGFAGKAATRISTVVDRIGAIVQANEC